MLQTTQLKKGKDGGKEKEEERQRTQEVKGKPIPEFSLSRRLRATIPLAPINGQTNFSLLLLPPKWNLRDAFSVHRMKNRTGAFLSFWQDSN